jgi:hypothetical protein
MRRDIEAASSYLWGPVVNRTESEVRLRNIERRLTLLVAHVGDEQRRNAFMAAQKLGHVYRETSDVLHGRISTAHFNEKRVEEWKSDLARFRKFLERLPLIRHVNLADS